MMSDETTLLPCPFCGCDDVRIAVTMHESWYYGECESCGGRTDFCDSQAEAIAAWNTRADYHGYEQAAIEAWKSIKTWNARAEHGTLTAEQVRETVAKHWQEPALSHDWQAIADELNAELRKAVER